MAARDSQGLQVTMHAERNLGMNVVLCSDEL